MILGLAEPTRARRASTASRAARCATRCARSARCSRRPPSIPAGARDHLHWLAERNDLPHGRVGEMLDLAGLTRVAGRRVGGYSLGVRQRLGIAAAMLGDPPALMLDEPVNGLDPEGVTWIRGLLRALAAEGRAILVSSHLMSELQDTADHVVVIGRGKLIADAPVERSWWR